MFKYRFRPPWIAISALAAVALSAPAARAATVTWNANAWGSPVDAGGTWSLTGSNWCNGSANQTWVNGYTARFGESSGTNAYSVQVSGPISASGLEFQSQAYSLFGNALTLTGSSPIVTVNAAQGTIDSPLSGSGGLIKAGSGELLLAGSNTYSGDTTISGGTLAIGWVGTLGLRGNYAGNISIARVAALDFNSLVSQTFSGVISGSGSLVKDGPGTLTITNVNSFGRGDSAEDPVGIASIHQGTIYVSPGGALTENGTEIDVGDVAGMTGILVLSGGTALTPWSSYGKSGVNVGVHGGSGIVTLTGNSLLDASCTANRLFNAFAIGVASSAGTVTVAGTSRLRAVNGEYGSYFTVGDGGTGTLTIQDQGLVQAAHFLLGSTFYGTSGGTGTLQLNGGTLSVPQVVNDQQTTGYLDFNGGLLQSTTGSTDFITAGGTLHAWVQAGGAVIDSNGNTIVINQPLLHDAGGPAADGGLTKVGAGMLVLTATNTYTGPTTISAGTLSVASGGNLGSGNLIFGGDGGSELDIEGAPAFSFSGAVLLGASGTIAQPSGGTATFFGPFSGSLIKSGSGVLILAGGNNLDAVDVMGGRLILATLSQGATLIVGADASSLFGSADSGLQAGSNAPPAAEFAAPATVPEPGTLALVIAAGLFWRGPGKRVFRRGGLAGLRKYV
jgi:fibronectin-binding autotransporter adhesin